MFQNTGGLRLCCLVYKSRNKGQRCPGGNMKTGGRASQRLDIIYIISSDYSTVGQFIEHSIPLLPGQGWLNKRQVLKFAGATLCAMKVRSEPPSTEKTWLRTKPSGKAAEEEGGWERTGTDRKQGAAGFNVHSVTSTLFWLYPPGNVYPSRQVCVCILWIYWQNWECWF